VFERLFGDGGSAAQRRGPKQNLRSILDSRHAEAARLISLWRRGQTKLAEYLDSVREIERRIQHTEAQANTAMELPTRPTDVPPAFEEHCKMMFDLVALAYRATLHASSPSSLPAS